MKTIITASIVSDELFYTAFVKSLVLREYKPHLEISLCCYVTDTIQNKIYYNTLKDKSIDVSHVYMVKNDGLSKNHSYSSADWEFIMEHEILECAVFDPCFGELLERKQPHQFLCAHFEHYSFNDFPIDSKQPHQFLCAHFEHYSFNDFPIDSSLADIICIKVSPEYLSNNQADVLRHSSNVLTALITENGGSHIFQNHKKVGEQPGQVCEEEYPWGYITIFTHVLRETKNVALAKNFANNATRSILNTINIRNYRK